MESRYAESIQYREREIALGPDNTVAYWEQATCCLGWRADTVAARRVVERGGPALEAWLVRLPNDGGMATLWHQVVGPSVSRAMGALTFAGAPRASPESRGTR